MQACGFYPEGKAVPCGKPASRSGVSGGKRVHLCCKHGACDEDGTPKNAEVRKYVKGKLTVTGVIRVPAPHKKSEKPKEPKDKKAVEAEKMRLLSRLLKLTSK
jgi:hypothetical protein